MSVWAVAPSIRPGGGTLPKWREAGYKLAVMRQGEAVKCANMQILVPQYRGWAHSVNYLIKWVMESDESAEWFVVANDDTEPDSGDPSEISGQCAQHFADGMRGYLRDFADWPTASTFGVMQPTGDLKEWPNSRIDKFAGSPWIGREFARRVHNGNGPLDTRFYHSFADEALQGLAQKLGVFWQRPDLTHKHLHWGRGSEAKPEWWDSIAGKTYHEDRALFEGIKRGGFAEGMVLLP